MKIRIYNKTLDPNLWDEKLQLNPEVRVALLKVGKDFYAGTELKSPLIDIFLIGSSANYNWTPDSDLDVHVVIDISNEGINPTYTRKFMDGLGSTWNRDHEIEIKGHPVEVYLQDQTEPNGSPETFRDGVAVYSILRGKWAVPPKPENVVINKDAIRDKYRQLKDQINELIASEDYTGLKSLMKKIKNYRVIGLKANGEFSTENLVFKALRHTGMLEKMKKGLQTSYDKMINIDEDVRKNKPFVVTGMTAQDLDVIGEKYYGGQPIITHGQLRARYGNWGGSQDWRYRSDINTLFWWGIPDEDDRNATKDWLETKYNVKNPREITAKNATDQIKQLVHYPFITPPKNKLFETNKSIKNKNNYLIVGLVNNEFQVIGKRDFGLGDAIGSHSIEHADLHGGSTYKQFDFNVDYSNWRYKSKNNTLYWWIGDRFNEDLLDVVLDYLHTKWNVRNPKVDRNKEHYFDEGHFIFETICESNKKDYIYYGNIDDYLTVNAVSGLPAHDEHQGNHHGSGKRWRLRTTLPYVFWWETPTNDEKETVEFYLYKKHGIKVNKHKNFYDFGFDIPQYLHGVQNTKKPTFEGKYNPFEAKELQFVTYGGLNLTKQKGFKNEPKVSFHGPPARRGIYAFVWPYVEKFLLGGYQDPKERGKGQRNRIQYIRDKEGNVITNDNPEYEKLSDIPKNWSLQRKRDDTPGHEPGSDEFEWNKEYYSVLFRNTPRKKFSYNGPIWHHLKERVKQHEILDEKGDWVKTDIEVYHRAFLREIQMMRAYKTKHGIGFTLDHLEVFIDQKI